LIGVSISNPNLSYSTGGRVKGCSQTSPKSLAEEVGGGVRVAACLKCVAKEACGESCRSLSVSISSLSWFPLELFRIEELGVLLAFKYLLLGEGVEGVTCVCGKGSTAVPLDNLAGEVFLGVDNFRWGEGPKDLRLDPLGIGCNGDLVLTVGSRVGVLTLSFLEGVRTKVGPLAVEPTLCLAGEFWKVGSFS
jgi:hypothetical protein